MKTSSRVLALFLVLAFFLAGCRSYPNLEADHWIHEGRYGVATTHYEATAVQKLPDGRLHVGTYSGRLDVMGGYGISDTVQGLTLPTTGTPVK